MSQNCSCAGGFTFTTKIIFHFSFILGLKPQKSDQNAEGEKKKTIGRLVELSISGPGVQHFAALTVGRHPDAFPCSKL